jgi:hypothetical protein
MKFLKNEFNNNIENANSNMNNLRNKAINLIQEQNSNNNLIEITHKIWITNINNPFAPNIESQNLIKNQYINLPHYKHYFWTNYPHFCNEFIKSWNLDSSIKIEIHDIEELKDYYGYKLYKAYVNQNLFAQSTDIVRLQIICKYGGLYSDIGFSFKPTIINIIKNFDITINGELFLPGIVSHNVLSCNIIEHNLFLTILKIINYKYKEYYNNSRNIYNLIELSSPRMLTAAVSSICNNVNILLIVNNIYTFDRYHNASWRGTPKYGCNTLEHINYDQLENDLN